MVLSINALVRLDCGPDVGFGHLVRCLAIADALLRRDMKVTLVYGSLSRGSVPDQLPSGVQCYALPGNEELHACLADSSLPRPDVLLVDHYGAGRENLGAPEFANCVRVLIEDIELDTTLPCELLVNPNAQPQLDPSDSEGAGDNPRHLLGPSYAPIRASIATRHGKWMSSVRPGTRLTCLISMGATDPHNLTDRIIKTLISLPIQQQFRFQIVLSSTAPHLEPLRETLAGVTDKIQVALALDVDDMASAYEESSCCIGAAGSSAWERACVGVPTAQLVAADNQTVIQRTLMAADAIVTLPRPDDSDFAQRLDAFLCLVASQDDAMAAFSARGTQLVDGFGADRIADAVVAQLPQREE